MRRWHVLIVLLALIAVGVFVPRTLAHQVARPTQQDQLCFAETGNCISGRFRQYWEQNGGLAVFGFPITTATNEIAVDGHIYLTQWFERNRFELHTEKAAPYDVLLGRLGDDSLKQQGRDWFTFPKGQQTAGCLWFVETSHSVCEPFKTYWETHGLQDPALTPYARSLALFGLPVSEPAMETNSSGDTVLTQWFERARFEYHPGNPLDSRVLLGLLGNEVRSTSPVPQQPAPSEPTQTPVPVAPTATATPVPVPTARPQPTATPRPAPTSPPAQRCHPSYPDFCIPPPPPDLNCGDIGRKNFTVRQPDPHRLDADKDGIGCEG